MEGEEDSQAQQVVQYQSFEETTKQSFNCSTPSALIKGKYYKQTYRPAWEQMPDFKGWLKGIPGEPTRAFCLYCQKSLHAHRLSLLKHTCTIRHQKAAQMNNLRKLEEQEDVTNQILAGVTVVMEGEDDTPQQQVESNDFNIEMEEYVEEEDEDDDDYDDENTFDTDYQNLNSGGAKSSSSSKPSSLRNMSAKAAISTHVLDTSKGQPVAGLQVSLYKLIDGRWTYINEGITNPDGRFSNFLAKEDFTTGRYKLHFDVDRYFDMKQTESMYPFIEIVFDCKSTTEHYHIPLLLGPFGYTTYRGT